MLISIGCTTSHWSTHSSFYFSSVTLWAVWSWCWSLAKPQGILLSQSQLSFLVAWVRCNIIKNLIAWKVQILSLVGKMSYHAEGLWIRKNFRKIFPIVSFEGISLLSIWFAAAGALIIKGISSVPSTEFAVQFLPLLQFWFLSKV